MMCIPSLQAQQDIANGSGILNLGVGVAPGLGGSVSFDYGVIDHWGPGIFTVGGYFGISGRKWEYKGIGVTIFDGDKTLTSVMIAARATYRYSVTRYFEAYGVLMPGVRIEKWKYPDNAATLDHSNISPDLGILAGCRFLFSDRMSVFAEMGYSVLCLNAGISLTF
ncbi:MAG: hypothetical protein LBS09_00360 [Bacteroidales bacterium]|jgi:hypothetical protein|nr:hypothetical protein [Bacteroidales bacterium]